MTDATVLGILVEAESRGVRLRLVDGKVKAAFPASAKHQMAPLLERLRASRDQVVEVLKGRSEIPPMPSGVRLVAWKPKQPPVVLESWSVVIDTHRFALTTLDQLGAALAGKDWLAGNRSVRELADRLEQVGVIVELGNP